MAGHDQRVPELSGGVDIRTLPLTAIDGFVLSRVDGHANLSEIVAMTGLPADQVQQILTRLVELGAIHWKGEPVQAPRSEASRPPSRTPPPHTPPPRSGSMPPSSSMPPRRRPSWSHPQHRKLFSEASISSPPPDLRSLSQRPRSMTPGTPSSRVPTPPPPVPPREYPSAESTPASDPAPRAPSLPPSAPSLPPSDSLSAPSLPPATPITAPVKAPALYDVRELEEEVELPVERRRQILDLYYRRKELDYYAILGVAMAADRKQIRTAYFTLSKAFHPDSMFRKELGSFKAKMTSVFESLTEAYETLSRPKTRTEYDAYLRSTRSIADAERALSAEPDLSVEVPPPPPLPSTSYDVPPPTPLPERPRGRTDEARRLAREVMASRLRRAGARAPAVPRASEPPPGWSSTAPTEERQLLARQLTRSLIDASKVSGANQVTRLMLSARAAVERGDLAGAAQQVAEALALAPERASIRAEHERLSHLLAEKLANDYAEHARFEAKHGKWASAAVSWSKVCEARPRDAPAHRSAAHALLKAGGDLRGAQKYAQTAVFLAPEDVDARILLAQIHLTVGLKLNARRELEAAAKLDPENEMVKNLFSELKG